MLLVSEKLNFMRYPGPKLWVYQSYFAWPPSISLVDLLDSRAGAAARRAAAHAAARHAALGHAAATCSLVDLHHDRVHDALELLLLCLELVLLGKLVLVKPVQALLDRLLDLLLVAVFELILELLLLEGVAHGEAVVLQAILGLDLCLVGLVLGPVLLSLL